MAAQIFRMQLDPLVPSALAAGILAALLLAAALSLLSDKSLSVRRRWAAGTLRAVALAFLAVVLWRPQALSVDALVQSSRLVILVDRSASMGLRDETQKSDRGILKRVSRREAADRLLTQLRQKWPKRKPLAAVMLVEFGARAGVPRPFISSASLPETASISRGFSNGPDKTDLAAALRQAALQDPTAVLLLTDGRATQGDSLNAARSLGRPCHVVPLGRDARQPPLPDLAVDSVLAPAQAKTESTCSVQVRVSATAPFAGKPVLVRLEADGKLVQEQEILLPASSGGGRAGGKVAGEAQFEFSPHRAGTIRLEASVRPAASFRAAGELTMANNRRLAFMKVTSDALRVMYIEGRLRWDYRFLRSALGGTRGIRLETVKAWQKKSDALQRALPRLRDAHVLVVGELAALSPEQATALRDAVGDGGVGLLVVAGRGGYEAGRVAELWRDILPVEVDAAHPSGDRPLRVRLARNPIAATHPALPSGTELELSRLIATTPRDDAPAGADTDFGWSALPALPSRVPVKRVKPTGQVLLVGDDGAPLLVTGRYGLGRTAVLLSGQSHVWAHGERTDAEVYRLLMSRLVSYVAGRDPSGQRVLEVALSAHTVQPGDLVLIEARYETGPASATERRVTLRAEMAPVSDQAPVTKSGGRVRQVLVLRPAGGLYVAAMVPQWAGEYEVRVTAHAGGRVVARAAAPLLVESRSREFETLSADHALLQEIARVTGGNVLHSDGTWVSRLADGFAPRTIERKRVRSLWDRWWLLAGFLVALTMEWWLRRQPD